MATTVHRGKHGHPRDQLGRNLTYGLVDTLGRAIVVGDDRNRAFLTEADISQEYGVSRSVTREAIKMLTAKGLLRARSKQGTFIQPESNWNLFDIEVLRWLLHRRFSAATLRQFNELRVAVEPHAAKLAAMRADAGAVSAITAALQRMREAEMGLHDPRDADIAFHVAILHASGNPFYAQLRDVVATALRTSIRFTNRVAGRTASVADHAAVHDAIVARKPVDAEKAMRALVDGVVARIDQASGEPALPSAVAKPEQQ